MLKYHIYEKQDFTLFTAEGEVSLDEWRQTLLSYDKDGPTKYELYDLRELANLFSVSDMFSLADLSTITTDTRPSNSKTAFLVSGRDHHGLSRIYDILVQARAATWGTKAFFSLDEAERWLGIDLGEFREELGV